MTESYREQHPLLGDNFSEEETYSPRFQRRFRLMAFGNRSGNKVRGAATIIRRWPNHWSTVAIYWWTALGMIAIATFIVYNIIISFTLLPPSEQMSLHKHRLSTNDNKKDHILLPNIFMHILVDTDDSEDLTEYLPYIKIIASKYVDYQYNVIMVVNDTNKEYSLSAEENNEIALNTLWHKSNVIKNLTPNIVLERVTLSKYMSNSPLGKYWRSIPHQFIEFLLRAICVWEKGGIAFNPKILSPRSPNALYIEKVRDILSNYKKKLNAQNITHSTDRKKSRFKNNIKPKKLNNIRDIIEAMENNEDVANYNQHSLTEAENKEKITLNTNNDSVLPSSNDVYDKFETDGKISKMKEFKKVHDNQELIMMAESKIDNAKFDIEKNHYSKSNKTEFNLFPLFLNFLFNDRKNISNSTMNVDESKANKTRKRKHVLPTQSYGRNKNGTSVKSNDNTFTNYTMKKGLMIIPVNNTSNDKLLTSERDMKIDVVDHLVIDLKGNILATKASCHAFIGTVFSNVVHHSDGETVTDFIITELSVFCKGLLSTCNGIDVILL